MTLRLNKQDKYFNRPLIICQKAYTNARRFYGIKQGCLLVIFYIDELKWKLMILIGLSKIATLMAARSLYVTNDML